MTKKVAKKSTRHELQFNVAQLLKEATGATRTYNINSRILNKLDADTTLLSPISGEARFLRTGSDILVTGTLETTLQKNCGRCLAQFSTSVSFDLEEQFYPTVDVATGAALPLPPEDEDDEANHIDEQHTLDLLEVIRQDLLLESDAILYCSPDCKGLCPYCGEDRNLNPCACEEDKIDSRWAGLLALQLEE
jgi:uncharacterized protein